MLETSLGGVQRASFLALNLAGVAFAVGLAAACSNGFTTESVLKGDAAASSSACVPTTCDHCTDDCGEPCAPCVGVTTVPGVTTSSTGGPTFSYGTTGPRPPTSTTSCEPAIYTMSNCLDNCGNRVPGCMPTGTTTTTTTTSTTATTTSTTSTTSTGVDTCQRGSCDLSTCVDNCGNPCCHNGSTGLPNGAQPIPADVSVPADVPTSCTGTVYFVVGPTVLCPSGPTYLLCDGSTYSAYVCANPGPPWTQETSTPDPSYTSTGDTTRTTSTSTRTTPSPTSTSTFQDTTCESGVSTGSNGASTSYELCP